VEAEGGTVSTRDSFPVSDTAEKFRLRLPEIRRRVGENPAKVLCEMESYKGGNGHLIWALHQLDIIDKHRLILTAVGAFSSMVIATSIPTARGPAWGRIPREWAFPVIHGTEIVRYAGDVDLREHDKPRIGFEISLYELAILKGESLVTCLSKLCKAADAVVDELLRFL
jgi:hypothetical protein